MFKLSEELKGDAGVDALLLVVGIMLALVIVTLGHREYRRYRAKGREQTTRLMIGPFDLYSPVDREKVDTLIYELYTLYRTSHAECGITLPASDEQYDLFVRVFAHPYINGKYDLSFLPSEVAVVFRKHHDQYLKEKAQPA